MTINNVIYETKQRKDIIKKILQVCTKYKLYLETCFCSILLYDQYILLLSSCHSKKIDSNELLTCILVDVAFKLIQGYDDDRVFSPCGWVKLANYRFTKEQFLSGQIHFFLLFDYRFYPFCTELFSSLLLHWIKEEKDNISDEKVKYFLFSFIGINYHQLGKQKLDIMNYLNEQIIDVSCLLLDPQ